MKDQALFETLTTLPLDSTPGRPAFLDRLCLASGWTRSHARRIIAEYRKFLYLCAVYPEPMAPPGDVDQVWQLHLTYTQSYWEDLCMNILRRPLHHAPMVNGREDRARYYVWYERARRRYQQEFGEAPPADIWVNPDDLFGPDRIVCERVNLKRYWIVPKPRLTTALLLLLPAIGVPMVAGLYDWAAGLIALALTALGIVAAALWADHGQRRGMAR